MRRLGFGHYEADGDSSDASPDNAALFVALATSEDLSDRYYATEDEAYAERLLDADQDQIAEELLVLLLFDPDETVRCAAAAHSCLPRTVRAALLRSDWIPESMRHCAQLADDA